MRCVRPQRSGNGQVAAALLTREDAIVAGRAAAYLHDLPGFRQGRPVLIVGATGNARSPLATVIRSVFDLIERDRVRGFEITAEADTIVTLARDHSAYDLERVVDEVMGTWLLLCPEARRRRGPEPPLARAAQAPPHHRGPTARGIPTADLRTGTSPLSPGRRSRNPPDHQAAAVPLREGRRHGGPVHTGVEAHRRR
jgi:hypothetical protein